MNNLEFYEFILNHDKLKKELKINSNKIIEYVKCRIDTISNIDDSYNCYNIIDIDFDFNKDTVSILYDSSSFGCYSEDSIEIPLMWLTMSIEDMKYDVANKKIEKDIKLISIQKEKAIKEIDELKKKHNIL